MRVGCRYGADLRSRRPPASAEQLERFETDVLAGLVLALGGGPADGTIRGELSHLDQLRDWLGRPLRELEPRDADAYFGRVRARTHPRRLRAKKQDAKRLVAAGITDTPESLR
jgi:hypothetical protein